MGGFDWEKIIYGAWQPGDATLRPRTLPTPRRGVVLNLGLKRGWGTFSSEIWCLLCLATPHLAYHAVFDFLPPSLSMKTSAFL